MAMLNFKYGLYENLPAYDESKLGTIYVTSDEHAMYIDLPKDAATNPKGRIRLSQIISVPTITDWENMKPPYSEEAFYYIVEANALLKYNGTKEVEGATVHDWKQINSTKALKDEIDALELRVKAIEDANYTGEITAIKTALENLGKKDAEIDQSIETINTNITNLNGDVADLEKLLSFKGTVTELPGTATLNDTCIFGGEIYIYHEASDGTTKWEVYDDVIEQIEKLKKSVNNMATSETIVAINQKVSTLEEWKATAQPAIEKAQTDATQGINDAATAQGAAEAAQSAAEAAQSAAEAADAKGAQGIADAAAAKTAADEAAEAAQAANELAASKATIDDVKALGYITTEDAQDLVDGVKGTSSDDATKDTVFGAKAAAAAASAAAAAAQTQADKGVADAAAAQKRADDAYALAEGAQSAANDRVLKTEFESFKTDNTAAIADAKKAGTDAQGTATEAKTAAENAQEKADDAYTLAEGKTTLDEVKGLGYATTTYVNEETGKVLGTAADDATANTVFGAKAAAAAAKASATAGDEKVDQEIENREKAIEDLKKEIVSDIQTADAMVFIDVVSQASDLPSIGAVVNEKTLSAGWTYKAIDEFTLTQGEGDNATITPVYIGDLLIASGAEDENGHLTTLEWKHVPAGYVADYNPKMDLVAGTNSAVISLTSGANKTDSDTTNDYDGDLGSVVVKAATDSAVTVSAVGSEIAIGMVWGEF